MTPAASDRARDLAAREHAGQQRKANHEPYLEHVSAVAELVAESGFDDDVVAAALLHDTVEHTEVESGDVRTRFGERIATLVAAMTDREEIDDWEARKAEHRERVALAGSDACAIYAADKIAGIREARDGYAEVGEAVEERLGNSLSSRIGVWEADLEMLAGTDPAAGVQALRERLESELSRLKANLSEPGEGRPPGSGGGPAAAPTA